MKWFFHKKWLALDAYKFWKIVSNFSTNLTGLLRRPIPSCTTNFLWYRMVHEWYRIMVQIWYKYGTSMVQSQNMVQLWRKFGRIMVQNYGTSITANFCLHAPKGLRKNLHFSWCEQVFESKKTCTFQSCTILAQNFGFEGLFNPFHYKSPLEEFWTKFLPIFFQFSSKNLDEFGRNLEDQWMKFYPKFG